VKLWHLYYFLTSLPSLSAAFEFLKDNIGRKWRELARTQGLTQTDIHAIEDKYPHDLKEQSYQALLQWEKNQKGRANIASLVQDLRKRHLNQMANDIECGKYKS
jgi:predicted transcriptional regulator